MVRRDDAATLMLRWLKRVVIAAVLLAAGLLGAGQLGALQGTAPTDLGVRDGRLKAPATTPNSVSSQADLWPGHPQLAFARIAPLPAQGDAAATMARLQAAIAAMPGARIVDARDGYVYAQFTSRWLRFVDDAEFWFDPVQGVVQVRSASRLGEGDLGANRARIEALRSALQRPA